MDSAASESTALIQKLDTTRGSIIHYLLRRLYSVDSGTKFVHLYIAAIAITFGFLVVVAGLTGGVAFIHPQGSVRLPFFYDVNIMFTFLVSFPCLIILTATDQQVLIDALTKVQSDETIEIRDQRELANDWNGYFATYNLIGQALGAIVGVVVAAGNYVAHVVLKTGLWISDANGLLPVGWVYLFCIFIFYAVATVYVVRNLAIALLLRAVVKKAKVRLLPLHPDRAGGLRPVGRLGLRNQYALTLIGFNVALLFIVYQYLNKNELFSALLAAAVVAYLVIGPLVFMAPLLPFRSAMRENKDNLMNAVAKRTRQELDSLYLRLISDPTKDEQASGPITKEDEELIDRLRKIAIVIDELPIWPFDAATLRKFLTAYAIPIISGAYPLAKAMVGSLGLKWPWFG
jgi:hypothetical protein